MGNKMDKDDDIDCLLNSVKLGDFLTIQKILKNNNKYVNLQYNKGMTILHYAAKLRDLDSTNKIIEILLDYGANINCQNEYGYTPIYYAIANHSIDIVKTFVNKGININLQDKDGDTVLQLAIGIGAIDIIKLLLATNIDVNLPDKDGNTALHYATIKQNLDITRLLLATNIDVNLKNNAGDTALHSATIKQNLDIIKLLLEAGANINIKDNNKWTPFHTICRKANDENSVKIAKLFLQYGVDVNLQDNQGWMSLHKACIADNYEMVKLLLENDADVNIKNEDDMTPIDIIIKHTQNKNMINLLMQYGAKLNNYEVFGNKQWIIEVLLQQEREKLYQELLMKNIYIFHQ